MTTRKTTKRALLLSCLSMLLCLSMLVGSTFAWFTDTATTGVNTIQAGNLDIKLSYKNAAPAAAYKEVTVNATDLFVSEEGKEILWEPGATAVCYFKLENLGSLALQYKMAVSYADTVTYTNAAGKEVKLSEALKSAVVELSEGQSLSNEAAISAAMGATAANVALGYKDAVGKKMEAKAESTRYFAIVIHMPTSVDNTYNLPAGARPLEIQLGIDLIATQVMHENDSFGNTYDEFAKYPDMPDRVFAAVTLPFNSNAIDEHSTKDGWSIKIPANAIGVPEGQENPKTVTVMLECKSATDTEAVYTFSITDENGNALTLKEGFHASLSAKLGVSKQNVAGDGFAVSYDKRGTVSFNASATGDYKITYTSIPATVINSAEELVNIAADINASSSVDKVISLGSDIDMTNAAWTGINVPVGSLTIYGNGFTISNIVNTTANAPAGGLVNQIGSGSTLIIEDLNLDGITVNTTGSYAGAVVAGADSCEEISMSKVHVANATVVSGNYAAGFVAFASGYQAENNGPVYGRFTITDCSLTDSELTGGGSTGAVFGQAGANTYSTVTISGFAATGNTIKGERTDKTGVLVGSANEGIVVIDVDAAELTGNTVFDGTNNDIIVGRLVLANGNTTGYAELNGVKYNVSTYGTAAPGLKLS